MPKWETLPIPFWVNERGLSQIANGSEFEAVQLSFRTWEAVPSADVRFNYRGLTPIRSAAHDGINLVSFADDSTPLGTTTIAVTLSYFRLGANNDVFFDESDIVFSPDLEFSTSGENNKFDIQAVLTHEIGHFLGMDHSALVSSVMVPFSQAVTATGTNALSVLHQRTLAYDDIAGISEIYPKTSGTPPVGQIRGFVLNGGLPVFGAHVVAVDQNGVIAVSTEVQPLGDYLLRFVPPGTYRIYAEPLDLPVTEAYIGGGSTSFYRNLKTDFATTYYGNVSSPATATTVQVVAGAIPLISHDIQILPKGTTGLNLTRPAFGARIPREASGTLTVGGEDITAGTSFSSSGADINVGSPTYGGRISTVASTSASMPLSVAANAALGPRAFTVNRGTDSSVGSGAIVIVDKPPVLQQVSPSSGPNDGGSLIQITGTNFRPGAKVFLGGLPATTVSVLDSSTIAATVPPNAPGPANVQVFNSDGTSGTSTGGFNYLPPTPTITSIAPLAGPPATAITITGTQFDKRSQNIQVLINGNVARVASATPTQIVAVVPYGATSGPITVSVFGIRANGGADFTVTAASSSTNRAANAFSFVDAAGVAGNLAFLGSNGNDDGVASVPLPFTFSLFNDIYLAGSNISVSTNGWLSLESGGDALAYQNGPLPGVSVVDASGTARSIPPSLIAPFFDDLALIPGVSSVSTKVVGTAPNRQFVIQWTKLTILNEDGNDQRANLIFQAVLYEGSNDIQLTYQTLTGNRSNGVSATVGIQNLARDRAVQSSFNRARLGSGFFITYRFAEGGYTVTEGDSTPPTRPVVLDTGAVTASRTELSASWTSQDVESGIREFQYAIGRTPGASDIRPFTTTTQSSVTATGLTLDVGATYYFAVKAINGSGLTGEAGVSDGIRIDPTFAPDIRIIPSAPYSVSEFSGIALLAQVPTTVVLKALDANGSLIGGAGVRNPLTVSLNAGQQYARLVQELFSVAAFDGWIEIESSVPGLGVYTATGSWDLSQMDGSVARETARDFVVFHPGGSAVLINPSTRPATVTISEIGTSISRTLTIAPRAKVTTAIAAISRIQSSEDLASVERFGSGSRLGIGTPVPVSAAQSAMVIPNGVTGAGYVTTLALANTGVAGVDVTVSFAGFSRILRLESNTATRISLADFLQIPVVQIRSGAVRVNVAGTIFGTRSSLVGVVDIQSLDEVVSLGSRPASTDSWFAHVAHGNGLFTGLALATGSVAATITVDVYPADGGAPKSATFTLGANQQTAKLISELVLTITTQMGGYIRVRSDQPIWAWEVYGSDRIMASGPPL